MAGFLTYLKFIIRRERIISSLWIFIIALFTISVAALFPELIGDTASKAAMVELLKSPAMVGMMGPVYAQDSYTASVAFAQMMGVWVMITVGAMNIFFVNRHTRVDEEYGRLEMLRSLPMGKLTNPMAAITGALLLNLIIALLNFFGLVLINIDGTDLAGAAAYCGEIFVFGLIMAAITLLSSQMFSTARGSAGTTFALLGIFYLMRAAGDFSDNIVSYISPMGLALRVFPFYENNAYPIVFLLIISTVITLCALAICAYRDLGEGVIPAKKGHAAASQWMCNPLGLAWKLSKNSALTWCIIMFIIAAMYGVMFGDIESFIESNDMYRQMLTSGNLTDSMNDSFIAMIFLIMSHFAAIPVIMITNKLHGEERRGRLEPILSRSVCRIKMFSAYILIAAVEGVAVLFFSALGLYSASASVGVALDFAIVLQAAMCYLPAMWIMIGISVFFTGFLPNFTALIWAILGYSFVSVYLGQMFSISEIFLNLTPFGHIPRMPIGDFALSPLFILFVISVLLTALGLHRFKNRDLH